jgi:hypothetical protein
VPGQRQGERATRDRRHAAARHGRTRRFTVDAGGVGAVRHAPRLADRAAPFHR